MLLARMRLIGRRDWTRGRRDGHRGRVGIWETVAVLLAGVAAGTINTVVGTGSLVSFPTLLALGVPPVVANASNTTGLVPGGLSGTFGALRNEAW